MSEGSQSRSRRFTIGDFSKVTGLTVKTLRFYHEQGLLVPAFVDPRTDYRYYDASQADAARAITFLRGLEVPVAEIAELLNRATGGGSVVDALERHRSALLSRAAHLRKAARTLDAFLAEEKRAAAALAAPPKVEEKTLDPLLVAGVRMKGRYDECGRGFATVGRAFGRHLCGPAMLLHYDHEYKEDDADFEACMPVRQAKSGAKDVSVRELPGGRCVSLLHAGPYDQLGRSYAVILNHVKEAGHDVLTPTREVYLKGPGMIFKGNPQTYLTEIQMLVEPPVAREGVRS